jgi:PAS domain S-box-containing protein
MPMNNPSGDVPQNLDWLVQMFQNSPAAVAWLEGPDLVFRYVNSSYLGLVGPRDLWGRPFAAALPEVVAQGFLSLLQQAYASGKAHSGKGTFLKLSRREGPPDLRVVDYVFQPADLPGAAMRGVLIQATDVTDRVLAEKALQASEARFRAITNSIDQMIWSTRPDGFHDFYNERWYDYTGVPRGSTDGEGWNGMFHPDDRDRAWAVWRHSLETGEPYQIEYRLRHASGEYRWVLGRARPVRDEDGNILRWFGTCTDIQELIDMRERLRSAAGEPAASAIG